MGRPTKKYEDYIDADTLEFIRKCKAVNIADEEIYKKIGISKTIGIRWKRQYQDFLDSFKNGQEELLIDLENQLYKRAMGYDVDDSEVIIKTGADGSVIEKTVKKKRKHIWSDSNLQMILKKLNPEKWGDKDQFTIKPEKIKEMIEKMTPEELEVLLK